jgi:hypothetical protein
MQSKELLEEIGDLRFGTVYDQLVRAEQSASGRNIDVVEGPGVSEP